MLLGGGGVGHGSGSLGLSQLGIEDHALLRDGRVDVGGLRLLGQVLVGDVNVCLADQVAEILGFRCELEFCPTLLLIAVP